jgi:nucleotide-binding universal stress UspA family protein
MFDNAVIGVDDDQAGQDALRLAKQLVSADGALMLVHVEVVSLEPAPESDPIWVAQRQQALEQLASLRNEAQVDAELLAVQARSVADGLREAVSRDSALLAIGASRSDEYQRAFIGDDTRAVLKDPPCAVAVAPAGYAMRLRGLSKIGVAYNRSPESEQALALAKKLAREHQAELSAFEAVPEPIYLHHPHDVEAEIQEGVANARRGLAELGDLEPQAASGDAAEELARYAASLDLLVLGSHQHRPVDRLLGGSTSQRLADRPPCPLLVMSSRRAEGPRA